MFFRRNATTRLTLVLAAIASSYCGAGRECIAQATPGTAAQIDQMVSRGISFLQSKGQAADGSYSAQAGIGVTALITTGVLRNGRAPSDPLVAKSLKYLEGFVQPDGGIYKPGSFLVNYETCLAMVCFTEANADGRYKEIIANADKFVRGLQVDEADQKDKSNVEYGGATYGGRGRPDLSNTTFLIEALKSVGSGPDDPAMQKALIFVSRCQNLESEHNATAFAAKNPDGGFYYTPAAEGANAEDKLPGGGLRSYGSMTYAGLKSMIFAGVGPDDPRVKAATDWIRKHYDLKSNPGMGTAGLYYYYHLFAKALDAMKVDTLEDAQGVKHDWRQELVTELAGRQQPDGSWINDNRRWMETDPNLVTGFVLLTLSYCRPDKPAAAN